MQVLSLTNNGTAAELRPGSFVTSNLEGTFPMFPMTPLQSWAFIGLLVIGTIGLIFLGREIRNALERHLNRRLEADETAAEEESTTRILDELDEVDRPAQAMPVPGQRPRLRLIQGGASPVYDWAKKGL